MTIFSVSFPRLLSVATCAMLCGMLPHNVVAAPAMQTTKPIYPWRTEAQQKPVKADAKDGAAGFSHCQSKNMYDNGILLVLAENPLHQRRLVLEFPQDKLVTKESYDLQWQVDRQGEEPVTAIAAGPRTLAIALDDALTRQIARGNILFLRGPNDTLGFDMIGVQDAVRALQDCLVSNNVKPAPINFAKRADGSRIVPTAASQTAAIGQTAATPQPAPQTAATATGSTPTPSNHVPAVTLPAVASRPVATATPATPAPAAALPAAVMKANNTEDQTIDKTTAPATTVTGPAPIALPRDLVEKLTQAGIGPQNIVRVPDDARARQPFDVVWKRDNVLVGLTTGAPVAANGLKGQAADFSNVLQQICRGEFLAEGGEPEQRGDTVVMPAEIACNPVDTQGRVVPPTVSAFLLISDARALHIVLIEGPAAQGAQTVAIRDKLMAQY